MCPPSQKNLKIYQNPFSESSPLKPLPLSGMTLMVSPGNTLNSLQITELSFMSNGHTIILLLLPQLVNSLTANVPHHMETSFCNANQLMVST